MPPRVRPELPDVPGVEHHDVIVNGLRLHLAEAGEGEPLILQHGWPQHWYGWRYQIPTLAERYRVICPDMRGHGWSEAPADDDYLKETLVDDVIGLLAELGLERVRYVGHDWGAWVGFLLCLRRPELVERFVALSVAHPWVPTGPPDPRRLPQLSYQVAIAAPALGPLKARFFEQALRGARVRGAWSADELESYIAVVRQPAGLRASTHMYRTFLLRELKPLVEGRYREQRLTTPTRLLIGDRDPIFSEDTLHHYNADDMAVEVVPGIGHFMPEEDPELVNERVLGFVG